jgi:hypothetical protein
MRKLEWLLNASEYRTVPDNLTFRVDRYPHPSIDQSIPLLSNAKRPSKRVAPSMWLSLFEQGIGE